MTKLLWTLLMILTCVPLPTLAQDSWCNAILSYGVFDEAQTLDQRSRYELVKRAHCKTQAQKRRVSGGLGLLELFDFEGVAADAESRYFCSSNFNEIRTDRLYWKAVSQASRVIVDAWLACVQRTSPGLTHYFRTTSSPGTFIYKIVFRSDGEPYQAEIKSWQVHGASCEPQISPGHFVDSAGIELLCHRNPRSQVTVSVNADRGAQNLHAIHLPSHQEVKPDFKPCTLYRSRSRDDRACNSRTRDGYYWRLIRKIHDWSIHGVEAVGEQPYCGPTTVGEIGKSGRFPLKDSVFRPVHEGYRNKHHRMTARKCNYVGEGIRRTTADLSDICGIFEFECAKQGD